MIDKADNIRQIKLKAGQPLIKNYYRIPSISPQRRQRLLKELENKTDAGLDKWFDHMCSTFQPICTNCGMEAMWILKPEYKMLWRSCQAHILPKRPVHKGGFPSLGCNHDNHIVLFPSFGGWLCGCHSQYDSSWLMASKMNIWETVAETFKTKLYPLIPPNEVKNIPEQLLLTLSA